METINKKEQPNTRPAKVISGKEARSIITKGFVADNDPSRIMEKVGKLLTRYHSASSDGERKKVEDELVDIHGQAASVISLDNHYCLGETTTKALRPLAIELCKQIIKEYECKTASEKTLAELAAAAYIKVIRYSTTLKNAYDHDYINSELNKFISVTSNEIDRAYRQYLAALTTLKQIKAPHIAINIKTHTAFMANNQQLNIGDKKNENN